MIKKEMIAMLLAGGQGSRLGVLTSSIAKPAVAFGGKYRIIDFPLSNCINSGVDTVGVLTQYQPLRLNTHIGIGIPWDLDRNIGGVSILPPYEKSTNAEWYSGTANAIYQNLKYMEYYNPEYVLILGGDHIYKMDYEVMLDFHKSNKADITIATLPVPMEEASRFGVVITDETKRILEFEEKPPKPRSNLASMVFTSLPGKCLDRRLSISQTSRAVILESISSHIATGTGSEYSLTSTTATGRMSGHCSPTGNQTWSLSTLYRSSISMRSSGRSTRRAMSSRRST